MHLPFLRIMRPAKVLSSLWMLQPLLLCGVTLGGFGHSSTYDPQKSAPLPREATVWAYARSRATAMLRRRKKRRMVSSCVPMKKSVASVVS
jgi:hypothetical protein